jgi:predicted nucleic acid-binding protein
VADQAIGVQALLTHHLHGKAEILLGARLRIWEQARRRQMEEYLRSYVEHPYDARLCEVWAEVTDAAQRSGRPIPCADAWIAATALLHDAALVTHDPDDFAGVPRLRIVSAKPGRPPRV